VNLSAFSHSDISNRLKYSGLNLEIGAFRIRVNSKIPDVIDGIEVLYADYPVLNDDAFIDFHVGLSKPKNLRRWIHPQVLFYFDDRVPFKPLPLTQAFPFFEWGLNWCVAAHSNNYVILHAAVVEKNGYAVIFPGQPGAGKSTLCAALVLRGWRLLSDEMAVIDVSSHQLIPVPRPISLKNESIEVIRSFSPNLTLGPIAKDTSKGTVTHVKVPQNSIRQSTILANPAFIVKPNYTTGAVSSLEEKHSGEMFMHLIQNAFNYSVLGEAAFETLGEIVNRCHCYEFTYHDLEDAIKTFDSLVDPQQES
jgi:HprK-related kinase A